MSGVSDRKRLALLIFHRIHSFISNKELVGENDIRREIRSIFKEILPENAEVELTEEKELLVTLNRKQYKIPVQRWVDSLEILYESYFDFLHGIGKEKTGRR